MQSIRFICLMSVFYLFSIDLYAHDNIHFESRIGYFTNNEDDLHKDQEYGLNNSNGLKIYLARLKLNGNFSEKVQWKSVIRLNYTWENLKAIEEAYINYKHNDFFGIKVGKIWTGIGGVEGNWSSADIGQYSLFDSVYTYYSTGLALDFYFLDQAIQIIVYNHDGVNGSSASSYSNNGTNVSGTQDKEEGLVNNDTTPSIGITWYGNLYNQLIRPIFSYHMEKTGKRKIANGSTPINASKTTEKYLSLGTRINLLDKQLKIELDYLKSIREVSSSTTSLKNDKEVIASLVSYLLYNINQFELFAKYEVSKKELNKVKIFARPSYWLGVNYHFSRENKFFARLSYRKEKYKYKTSFTGTSYINGDSSQNSSFNIDLISEF